MFFTQYQFLEYFSGCIVQLLNRLLRKYYQPDMKSVLFVPIFKAKFCLPSYSNRYFGTAYTILQFTAETAYIYIYFTVYSCSTLHFKQSYTVSMLFNLIPHNGVSYFQYLCTPIIIHIACFGFFVSCVTVPDIIIRYKVCLFVLKGAFLM